MKIFLVIDAKHLELKVPKILSEFEEVLMFRAENKHEAQEIGAKWVREQYEDKVMAGIYSATFYPVRSPNDSWIDTSYRAGEMRVKLPNQETKIFLILELK